MRQSGGGWVAYALMQSTTPEGSAIAMMLIAWYSERTMRYTNRDGTADGSRGPSVCESTAIHGLRLADREQRASPLDGMVPGWAVDGDGTASGTRLCECVRWRLVRSPSRQPSPAAGCRPLGGNQNNCNPTSPEPWPMCTGSDRRRRDHGHGPTGSMALNASSCHGPRLRIDAIGVHDFLMKRAAAVPTPYRASTCALISSLV